ncbi:efflux RND transporter periplasmic adaptor subunit [Pseudoalteromonas denitrificans]|uniref:RND family efflux transporter, MFP subunit n=1 Tax=Pseudoalteromonas denitrificans DSM 6059 TaxID=1123010 RepID=A0A1I1EPF5_9GAMM|nr:efflux RND transporter periplasmic adaptor subunit [Pseudoalteromonas denitrificans]SFB88556.1 RND family efflux transporter, MFP subunit [Pseudoalteromonas denitrificans DSM 6059]
MKYQSFAYFGLFIASFHISSAENTVNIEAMALQQMASYQVERQFSGRVIKQQDAKLAFEFSGKIKKIHFDQGDKVTKNTTLITLDTRLLDIEKLKLLAKKKRIEAELTLAKLDEKRLDKLKKQNYSAEQNLDKINTQINVYLANISEIQAAITGIDLQIEKSHLNAPFDGILGQRYVALGEVIAAGAPTIRILEKGHNQIQVGVPEHLKSTIKPIMPVIISGQEYQAKVLSKGAEIDPISHTLSMRFSLPDNAPIYAGQVGRLKIKEDKKALGYWVPLSALTDGIRGTWNIYHIKKEEKSARLKPVIVKVIYTDGKNAFISAPLPDKSKIVANGLHKVSTDIAVKIVKTRFANSANGEVQ